MSKMSTTPPLPQRLYNASTGTVQYLQSDSLPTSVKKDDLTDLIKKVSILPTHRYIYVTTGNKSLIIDMSAIAVTYTYINMCQITKSGIIADGVTYDFGTNMGDQEIYYDMDFKTAKTDPSNKVQADKSNTGLVSTGISMIWIVLLILVVIVIITCIGGGYWYYKKKVAV